MAIDVQETRAFDYLRYYVTLTIYDRIMIVIFARHQTKSTDHYHTESLMRIQFQQHQVVNKSKMANRHTRHETIPNARRDRKAAEKPPTAFLRAIFALSRRNERRQIRAFRSPGAQKRHCALQMYVR